MKTPLKTISSLLMTGFLTVGGCGGLEGDEATGSDGPKNAAEEVTNVETDEQGLFGVGYTLNFGHNDDDDDDPRWRHDRYERDRWRCTASAGHHSYSETRHGLRQARRAARRECRRYEEHHGGHQRCRVERCVRR